MNKFLSIIVGLCIFSTLAYSKGQYLQENQTLGITTLGKENTNDSQSSSTKNYQITFKIPAGTDVSKLNISFAPLKYNKRFAYGITSDDQRVAIWSQIFQYFRGGWVDDEESSHYNMAKTTGAYAPRALTYTDGCGVERIFGVNAANWYNLREQYWSYPLDKENPNRNWPFLVWEEQEIINDFDGSCSFHDVQSPDLPAGVYGGGLTENIDEMINNVIKGYTDANDNHIKPRLKRGVMVLTEPNGYGYYTSAAEKTPFIKMITRQANDEFTFVNLADPTINLEKFKVGRYFNDPGTFENHRSYFYNNIVSKSVNGVHLYGEFGLHGLVYKGNDVITSANIKDSPKIKFFDWLCDTYGNGKTVDPQTGKITKGSDELWFATNDEVYQYKYLSRDNTTPIRYYVDGDSLRISLSVPQIEDFYWSEYTLLIDGIDANKVSQVATDQSIFGMSYGTTQNDNGEKVMMLNLNYDQTLLDRANKYITMTQNSSDNEGASDITEEYKRYAGYFIQRLKPELQKECRDKLDFMFSAPKLTVVNIDSVEGGVIYTPTVSILYSYTGSPAEYRLSKDHDMNNAEWKELSDTIKYRLSENESIRLYMQLRNEYGISNIDSSSIVYYNPSLVLSSINIDSNLSFVEEPNVTIKLDLKGYPTHYIISEDSTFSDQQWIPYKTNLINYELSSGAGTKTVYAKIKNDLVETNLVSCQVDYVTSTNVIISLAGERSWNQITYPLTKDLSTINLAQLATHNTYTSKKLKSKAGRDLDWYLELNNRYYLSNDECSIAGPNFSDGGAYYQPKLEGNKGVYEDIYIKKALVLNNNSSENQKGRIVFTLPKGEYQFKLLMSVSSNIPMNTNQLNTSWYRVDTNGKVGIPIHPGNSGFNPVNNTAYNAEIKNIVVDEYSDGNVILYLYNTGEYNARPAINLIEITKIK